MSMTDLLECGGRGSTPNRCIGIDHVNIVVEDLHRMKEFYENVFGMEVYRQAQISGSWIDAVTGLKDVVADVVFLHMASGSNLELIHYRRPSGERPDMLAMPNTKGLRHIAFEIGDMQSTLNDIRKFGVDVLGDMANYAADASHRRPRNEKDTRLSA